MEQWLELLKEKSLNKFNDAEMYHVRAVKLLQKAQDTQLEEWSFYKSLIERVSFCVRNNRVKYINMEWFINSFKFLREMREDLIDEIYHFFGEQTVERFYDHSALEDVVTFIDEYYQRQYGKNDAKWFEYWVYECNCECFNFELNGEEIKVGGTKELIKLMKGEL